MQASMHASELQGNTVMIQLMEYFRLHQPLGNVYLMPQCNPIGMDNFQGAGHQGRFDSATGDNWNRYYYNPEIDYKSFVNKHINSTTTEYKSAFEELLQAKITTELSNELYLSRARKLNLVVQKEAQKADYVLDLHTDTDAITYLYTASSAKKSAELFGYKHTLVIPNECSGALDEAIFVPWWRLQQEFAKQGREEVILKEGFTLELGSEEDINFDDSIAQTQGVLNYLKAKGIIDSIFSTNRLHTIVIHHDISNYKQIRAIEGGMYEWLVNAGDSFKADDIIGQYIQTSTMTKKELKLPVGGTIISIHTTGAICQGTQLLNLALDVK
jgi:predicted deacylase